MFSQNSVNADTVSGLSLSKIPIGFNLNGGNPSLSKIDGSVAIDFGTQQFYYVAGGAWKTFTAAVALTLGPVGAAPNANAGTITGSVLNLQPASASFPGVVNAVAQTFAGVKTFNDGVILNNLQPLMSSNYNTPTYFEQAQVTNGLLSAMILTCGANSGQIPAWHVEKVGRLCFLCLGTSTVLTVAAGPTVITAAAGTLPATFRPISVVRKSICFVTNGATTQQGYVTIPLDGSLSFAIDINGTGFTGTGQIQDCVVVYTN
jgi:hypothetical protein